MRLHRGLPVDGLISHRLQGLNWSKGQWQQDE
jgi:hypothetical protein